LKLFCHALFFVPVQLRKRNRGFFYAKPNNRATALPFAAATIVSTEPTNNRKQEENNGERLPRKNNYKKFEKLF